MKVVRIEKILESTFLNTESIEGQDPLIFGYGDAKELDTVLATKIRNSKKAYPLLWYVMPNTLKYKEDGFSGVCRFVLAHNTDSNWRNDQRFNETFEKCLYPYFEKVLDIIDSSSDFGFTEELSYSFTNAPNYSNASLSKNLQVDVWDAISIDVDLTFYNENDC